MFEHGLVTDPLLGCDDFRELDIRDRGCDRRSYQDNTRNRWGQSLGLPALEEIYDFDQTRTMDGFRPLFSGDKLRGATDVRGCQVEGVHGSQSVLFSFRARDLVDSFEIAHPFGISEESVIEGCFLSSIVKSSFGPHFEIEE